MVDHTSWHCIDFEEVNENQDLSSLSFVSTPKGNRSSFHITMDTISVDDGDNVSELDGSSQTTRASSSTNSATAASSNVSSTFPDHIRTVWDFGTVTKEESAWRCSHCSLTFKGIAIAV